MAFGFRVGSAWVRVVSRKPLTLTVTSDAAEATRWGSVHYARMDEVSLSLEHQRCFGWRIEALPDSERPPWRAEPEYCPGCPACLTLEHSDSRNGIDSSEWCHAFTANDPYGLRCTAER